MGLIASCVLYTCIVSLFLIYLFIETESGSLAKADLKLMIHLPRPPESCLVLQVCATTLGSMFVLMGVRRKRKHIMKLGSLE